MIIYKDILRKLAANGWTTLRLQHEHEISNGTIAQIRNGKPITTRTLDTICRLCNCKIEDIIEYTQDNVEEGE